MASLQPLMSDGEEVSRILLNIRMTLNGGLLFQMSNAWNSNQ
jgi:hypothetical protein